MFSAIEPTDMPSSESLLDPVVLLVACRRLDDAEKLAGERVARTRKAEPPDRLAAARATKALADILLESGKAQEAAPHVFEARRRYRPFRNDVALSADVDLTLAMFAFADARSLDGEQILAETGAATADVPGAALQHARVLRYLAHVQIARFELEKGDERMNEAIGAVQRARAAQSTALAPEATLLLSQYLFTQGEVAFMRKDEHRARERTAAALDLAETELRGSADYVRFARARAAHAHRVFGDMEEAEALEARAEDRHG